MLSSTCTIRTKQRSTLKKKFKIKSNKNKMNQAILLTPAKPKKLSKTSKNKSNNNNLVMINRTNNKNLIKTVLLLKINNKIKKNTLNKEKTLSTILQRETQPKIILMMKLIIIPKKKRIKNHFHIQTHLL